MPCKYFNKTRSPVALALRDGSPFVIQAKSWSEIIPKHQEGSREIARALRKDKIFRRAVTTPPPEAHIAPPAAPKKAAPKKAAPAPKKAAVTPPAPPTAPAPTPAPTAAKKTIKKTTKNRSKKKKS
jgi:hypothetical protein